MKCLEWLLVSTCIYTFPGHAQKVLLKYIVHLCVSASCSLHPCILAFFGLHGPHLRQCLDPGSLCYRRQEESVFAFLPVVTMEGHGAAFVPAGSSTFGLPVASSAATGYVICGSARAEGMGVE